MKKLPTCLRHNYQRAFSLVEMAVVIVIVGLVLTGLLVSLTAQVEQRSLIESRNTIANVKEALLGYAMANGRFPCPAAAPGAVTAVEAFAGGGNATNGNCANFFNGYVPSVSLGLTPTDTDGYVLDGWNNPIRYAIANLSDDAGATHIFTKSSGMKNANSAACPSCGMSWIATQTLLSVCSTGTGIAGGACSGTATRLTQDAVLVVYSTGRNAATGGTGTDEAANLNGDAAFVSHEPYAGANEFDDIVEWVSSNSVFAKLVQANQLP